MEDINELQDYSATEGSTWTLRTSVPEGRVSPSLYLLISI